MSKVDKRTNDLETDKLKDMRGNKSRTIISIAVNKKSLLILVV